MHDQNTIQKRCVSLDLLRILAMMGVLMNHVFNYGLNIYEVSPDYATFDVSSAEGASVWSVLELMKLVALVSVDCFVLISGYFLIDRTDFRWKGIKKVWSQTWVYAVGLGALSIIFGITPFSWSYLFESLTPVWHNTYWFVTSYIVLMLVAPFISRMVQGIDRKQYRILMLLGFVVCFQPLLGQYCVDDQNILLFFYLYIIGGYIRRYSDEFRFSKWWLIASFLLVLGIMFGYVVAKNVVQNDASCFLIYAMAYDGLVLPLAVITFIIFKRMYVPHCLDSLILHVAPLSFAVYIIHTQTTVSDNLWNNVSMLLKSASLYLLPLYCIAVCLVVFIACIMIEQCRVWIVKGFKCILK